MLFHFMMIYIRAKRRTNGDKIQTNFHSLNVPEDGVGYESFTIISIDYLVIFENKYYIIVTRNNIVWKLLFILLKDLFVSATLCRVHNFFLPRSAVHCLYQLKSNNILGQRKSTNTEKDFYP